LEEKEVVTQKDTAWSETSSIAVVPISISPHSPPSKTMTNQASAFSATLEANGVRRDMLNREMAKAEPLDQAARDVNARIAAATANIFGGFSSSHPYQTTFENEASRVMGFVNEQQVGIEIHAKELFRQANVLATSKVANVQESYASVQDLRQAIRKIADDSILLQDFFSNARTVLLDHAKMADDKLRDAVHCSQTVQEIMPKAHLNSALVCVVSDTYQALRVAEEKITHGSAGDAVWEAPSSFKRSTTKYWVKDENLTKLMMINSAEAPLLVYGKKGPLTSLSSSDLKSSDGDKLWDSLATVITSIYFDSDDMAMYKERIKRAEGAQLLRARWYGNKMPTGEKPVFLELKTHHEKWVAQKSVKERATIQAQDMVSFLRPLAWDSSYAETLILKAQPKLKKNADGLAEQVGLLMRMHNLVVKHNLTACVRTCYDRAAFQSSKSNGELITCLRYQGFVSKLIAWDSSNIMFLCFFGRSAIDSGSKCHCC
jgi:SPX domain protein involved in polyphosphate accumulation